MEHLKLRHRDRLDVARHNRLYHVRLCQCRKCLLGTRQPMPDRVHALTQLVSSVGKRRIEVIELTLRIRNAMQRQGINEDRLLSTTGHVDHLTQRLTNDLLKCALVNLATDLTDGDERVVNIPEDEGGPKRARCHEFYSLTLLSLSSNERSRRLHTSLTGTLPPCARSQHPAARVRRATGNPAPRTVSVFSLGGTIAMTNSADASAGVVPTLDAAALLATVPGLSELDLKITAQSFRCLPGASLSFDDISQLAAAVRDELDACADGVVITQGTDTIEETAYFLDLTVDRAGPVVVTGAMRNPTAASADGPGNLLAAVQAAASTHLTGVGCVVVMADEIHAAKHVHKMNSTSLGAFASPDTGPIGRVVEGSPYLMARPIIAPTYPIPTRGVRIGLITACLGDDAELLYRLHGGFDGLVIAGFGVGHVPAAFVDPLTYGFPGSERDLQDRGLINSGFLGPFKARVLLHVLIAADSDHHEIVTAFDAASGQVAMPG
jgi:L-asparaginase